MVNSAARGRKGDREALSQSHGDDVDRVTQACPSLVVRLGHANNPRAGESGFIASYRKFKLP